MNPWAIVLLLGGAWVVKERLLNPNAPIGLMGNSVVSAAVHDLSRQIGAPPAQIKVDSVSPQDFPDASLGCPDGGAYAQVITPGYVILLSYGGRQYDYRATKDGRTLKLCGGQWDARYIGPPVRA